MISALLLVLTLSLGGGVASKSNDSAATYENLRLFTEVLSIVQSQYVDEVPAQGRHLQRDQGHAPRARPALLVPRPRDVPRDAGRDERAASAGSASRSRCATTCSPWWRPSRARPAYRAGIQPGDRIVKIEGLSTKDMQLTDAVKRMRGKPGSKITISVVREGWAEPKDFPIVREQIRVQSVKSQQLEPGIEYIRLRQFQEQTVQRSRDRARQVHEGRQDPGAGPRPAQQPGRPPHLRGRGDGEVPRLRAAGRLHRGPRAQPEHALPGEREARVLGLPDRGAASTRAARPPPRSSRARSRTGAARS